MWLWLCDFNVTTIFCLYLEPSTNFNVSMRNLNASMPIFSLNQDGDHLHIPSRRFLRWMKGIYLVSGYCWAFSEKKEETLKSQRSVRRGLICSWGMSWVWTKCGSVKQAQMRLKVCKWCFIGMGCRSTLNVNQRKIWTPRLFRNNGCIMTKHMEGQEMKANQLALLCAVKDFLLSLI